MGKKKGRPVRQLWRMKGTVIGVYEKARAGFRCQREASVDIYINQSNTLKLEMENDDPAATLQFVKGMEVEIIVGV